MHPYYYAAGITLAPHLAVSYHGVEAGGALGASAFRSLDGHDRTGISDGLALHDTEIVGEGWFAVQLGVAVIRLDYQARHRASTIGAIQGSYVEHTALASVGVRL
jgi:hypothetical protein